MENNISGLFLLQISHFDYIKVNEIFGYNALLSILEIYPEYEKDRRQEIFDWAVENGHTEVVKLLLGDNRVDPFTMNDKAVINAVKNGHIDIAKVLVDVLSTGNGRIYPEPERYYVMMMYAVINGNIELVKYFLYDMRVDPTTDYNSAIRHAAREGNIDIVKLLLKDSRVDPSDFDNAAINWAAKNGHIEIVKLLLKDKRVDPSAKDNYGIKNAEKNGHMRVNPYSKYNFAVKMCTKLWNHLFLILYLSAGIVKLLLIILYFDIYSY